jgi:hypothetical protein
MLWTASPVVSGIRDMDVFEDNPRQSTYIKSISTYLREQEQYCLFSIYQQIRAQS